MTTSAHAVSSTEITSTVANNRFTDVSDEQINRYDRHVTVSFMGDFIIRSDSNLSPADKVILQQILTKSNQERRDAISSLPRHSQVNGNEVMAQGAGITFHWWGQTLWLDSLNSHRLSALLAGGAGIAAVAAFITAVTGVGGVVAGGIAAGLTLAAGVSLICNWNLRGINIHRTHTGQIWCSPR